MICSIVQESVLSGTLFFIYVNSLCDRNVKGSLAALAGDTLNQIKQNDINLLKIWFTNVCLGNEN